MFKVAGELHPWNSDFSWSDHGGPLRILTDEQVARFDQDGFFLFEHGFAPETVAAILAEIDGMEKRLDDLLRKQPNGRTAGAITFTTHLVCRSALLRGLVASAPLVDIAADLCGPAVRLYWDQAVYKKPEKPRRFPWHQDNGYAFVEPQQYLTCWIALTNATADNGCPIVVPGMHRMGTLHHHFVDPLGFECIEGHPDAGPVPASAGDIVVFSSLTPHLTGPNVTREVRKSWIVQYCPDGAEVLRGDPAQGPPTGREACINDDRQYLVVKDGHNLEPPPSAWMSADPASL
ncbi:MAG: phytanoyl-CoA dioxygenase family protein [Acidimicrobiales bacterium]